MAILEAAERQKQSQPLLRTDYEDSEEEYDNEEAYYLDHKIMATLSGPCRTHAARDPRTNATQTKKGNNAPLHYYFFFF